MKESSATDSVGHSASPIFADTLLPSWKDEPKSPTTSLPTQFAYCTGIGLSRP